MAGRGLGRGRARGGAQPDDGRGRGRGRGARGGAQPDDGRGRGRGRGARGGAQPDDGRGRGRGRGARGGVPLVGRGGGPAISTSSSTAPNVPAEHVRTVGVRRKGYGSAGTKIQVYTNHFKTDIPNEIIYHYDGTL